MTDRHEQPNRTRAWLFRHVATRYVDPVLRPLAASIPFFGVITHRGRTSGRIYRTPIIVSRRGDAYVFILTYESDVQWVENVLAAGSCSLESRGKVIQLVEPELITDPELRPVPAPVRFIEGRIAGVTLY